MTDHALPEESIFAQALEIGPGAERTAFLERACGDNPSLRAEVEALLRASERSGDLLDLPEMPAVVEVPVMERPGTVIGAYRLMEQIGEGGMGLVFVAEQYRPVRRKVALKVIKPGMDTRQVVARFEAERQALALMDHPNIARVLDGGETATGRPYFVMELVKGLPITEYCESNEVPVRQRLGLFVHVCRAVQHAHQKGIIHRDLKPSNVLVMSDDGTPVVKVIDFGVAKAVGQQLTDKTIYTQFTQLMGTPLYMSPEQAGESGRDVDTRTDIYALGVLLYELLTGTTPFDRERLKTAGFEEIRRIICEEEPPRPSTRVNTVGQATTLTSGKRRSDPGKLSRLFRDELDWIVMKALEKDRNRRYESASAFAADVERYLNHEAVQACPPSALYRLRKFVRRYRVPFAIGMLAAAVLVLAAVGLAVSNLLILHEHEDALRQRDEAQAQRRLARRAVDKMYIQVAERWLAGQPQLEPPQREFLEDALQFYQGFAEERSTDPELRLEAGTAYRRVGEIQETLGDTARAAEALHQAAALLEQLAADFPLEPRYRAALADSLRSLGGWLARRERVSDGEEQIQKSLLLREQLVKECPDDVDGRRKLAITYADLANTQLGRGRAREAVETQGRAVALLRSLPAEQADTLECRFNQACCLRDLGLALANADRLPEAVEAERQSLVLLEKLHGDWPKDANVRRELAGTLAWLGCCLPGTQAEEAEAALRRAFALQDRLVLDFPAVPLYKREGALGRRNLAGRLKTSGRFREAAETLGEALRLYEQLVAEVPFAPDYYWRELLETRHDRDCVLFESGRLREAEEGRRRSLELAKKLAADFPSLHHFRYLVALNYQRLGEVLGEAGRPREAETACRQALAVASELPASPAPELLGAVYRRTVADCHNGLADFLVMCPAAQPRGASEAVSLAEKAVEMYPERGAFWWTLGAAHYRAGDWNAAVNALDKAMELHNNGEADNCFFLAMAHGQLGHAAEARSFYDQAVACMEANQDVLEKFKVLNARACRFRAEAQALLGIRSDSPGGKQND